MSLSADQTYFLKQVIRSARSLGQHPYASNERDVITIQLRDNIREFLNKGYWCGNCCRTSGNPALESEVEEYMQFVRELRDDELLQRNASLEEFIDQVSSAPPFTSAPTTGDFTHGN
jgi:hypothetical protein